MLQHGPEQSVTASTDDRNISHLDSILFRYAKKWDSVLIGLSHL